MIEDECDAARTDHPTPQVTARTNNRRGYSSDRRYAKLFSATDLEETWRNATTIRPNMNTEEMERSSVRDSWRSSNASYRDYCESTEVCSRRFRAIATLPRDRRHSSGYFSLRSSTASRDSILPLQTIPSISESDNWVAQDAMPSIQTKDRESCSLAAESPTDEVFHRTMSSSSSSSDDDYESCSSGSLETLLSSKGIIINTPLIQKF